jgi:hypothetical protein
MIPVINRKLRSSPPSTFLPLDLLLPDNSQDKQIPIRLYSRPYHQEMIF